MRTIGLLLLVAPFVAACQRQVEVHGLYVNNGSTGYLFACGQQRDPLRVPDAALAAAYRQQSAASPGQPLFVRLRGVLADSGSIYGGVRYLLKPHVLKFRAPTSADCPSATKPIIPAAASAGTPAKG